MAQKVKKAIIAAAGMGTRFLPQTKAMPKEMLPIIDKPVIQLVVEGLVEAGVEDIIIVTGPTKRAIEDHFDRSLELENELIEKGKVKEAHKIKSIAEMANFVYIRQKGTPKGNARPILNAAHMLAYEPFFFFFADDFFIGENSTAKQLLDVYNKTGSSVVALRKVPKEDISSYGIASVIENVSDRVSKIDAIVEKPEVSKAPSDLAVGSGFILTPNILPILRQEKVGPDGEIRINDAVTELSKSKSVYGLEVDGEYHDTGNPEAYLKTLLNVTLKHKKYGPKVKSYIKEIIKE